MKASGRAVWTAPHSVCDRAFVKSLRLRLHRVIAGWIVTSSFRIKGSRRCCRSCLGIGARIRRRSRASRTGVKGNGGSRHWWTGSRPRFAASDEAERCRVEGSAGGRPRALFGLRLWASVCLALYVTFWLELDNAYWAGTSAALVCQPHLGASLRKGWFRMIGTVVGAVWIVALAAWFPQDRVGFLIGLALWGAACAYVATLLRNFACLRCGIGRLHRGHPRQRYARYDRRHRWADLLLTPLPA